MGRIKPVCMAHHHSCIHREWLNTSESVLLQQWLESTSWSEVEEKSTCYLPCDWHQKEMLHAGMGRLLLHSGCCNIYNILWNSLSSHFSMCHTLLPTCKDTVHFLPQHHEIFKSSHTLLMTSDAHDVSKLNDPTTVAPIYGKVRSQKLRNWAEVAKPILIEHMVN